MPPKKSEKIDPANNPEKKPEKKPRLASKRPERSPAPKPERKTKSVAQPEEQVETREPTRIEIKNSKGTVIGDFAHVVNNFIQTVDEKVLKRLGLEQRLGFFLIGLLLIGGFSGVYFGLRQAGKHIMTGEFRIAIASFAENGKDLPSDIGYTIAKGINSRMTSDLKEITVGPKVELWGPDETGMIKGATVEQRAANAEKLAKKIHAHMIIYGVVEQTSSGMQVTPEFYLDQQGFHQGSEVIGQYASASFLLPGAESPSWQFNFGKQMEIRTDIVSSMAQALSYVAVYEYGAALEKFQAIAAIPGWEDDQGKEVLYTFIGFTAGKEEQYDLARSALEKAIAIAPRYARPYVSMANLNYVLSLQPVKKSQDIKDVDQDLLDQCFTYLGQAVWSPEKPPLADVDAKIHFSRGQCYWLKTYSGQLNDYSLATKEFQQVLDAYDEGANPRLQEEAAESHARLGLIAVLTENPTEALAQYKAAVKLLADNPERQAVFQESVDELKQELSTQPAP